MSHKVKSIIWFLIAFFVYAVGAELMAEDYNGMPAIKDFEIVKDGEDLSLSFSFDNINGGLAEAKFTIGYIIERNGLVMKENIITNLVIVPEVEKTEGFETGKFQMIAPWLEAKDTKEIELKLGDTIKYLIFLKDGAGRKSNTISYEYELIEEWDI